MFLKKLVFSDRSVAGLVFDDRSKPSPMADESSSNMPLTTAVLRGLLKTNSPPPRGSLLPGEG